MANSPYKMKGSPFKRNFNLPAENIDDKEGDIIQKEKQNIIDTVSEDVENPEKEGPPTKYAAIAGKLLGSNEEDNDDE